MEITNYTKDIGGGNTTKSKGLFESWPSKTFAFRTETGLLFIGGLAGLKVVLQ